MSQQVREAQQTLRAYGFPCGRADGIAGRKTRRATYRFQRAWAGGRDKGNLLRRTGVLDPPTRAALRSLKTSGGHLSPHVKTSQVRCKHCGRCYILRGILLDYEAFGREFGRYPYIVSGFRCRIHNRNVGGASQSRHCYAKPVPSGAALDLDTRVHWTRMRTWGRCGGLGYSQSTGIVKHMDNRPTPAIWRYAS